MNNWKPIASAPRDGTQILVCEPHPGGTDMAPYITQARWVDVPSISRRNNVYPGWYSAYIAIYLGDAMDTGHWVPKPIVSMHPTHWMPLPKPPAPATLTRAYNKMYPPD